MDDRDDADIRLRPVDVARQFYRSPDWLKKLELQGIIPPAPRDFANRRYYTPGDVEQIRTILERRRVVMLGGDAA
jgi:DNA-binding transcriptional MerR regulator